MSVPQPLATFLQGVRAGVDSAPIANRTYLFATTNGGDWFVSTHARLKDHPQWEVHSAVWPCHHARPSDGTDRAAVGRSDAFAPVMAMRRPPSARRASADDIGAGRIANTAVGVQRRIAADSSGRCSGARATLRRASRGEAVATAQNASSLAAAGYGDLSFCQITEKSDQETSRSGDPLSARGRNRRGSR